MEPETKPPPTTITRTYRMDVADVERIQWLADVWRCSYTDVLRRIIAAAVEREEDRLAGREEVREEIRRRAEL